MVYVFIFSLQYLVKFNVMEGLHVVAYLEPCQVSKIVRFANIFVKPSIVDVWHSREYVFGLILKSANKRRD